MSVFRDPRAAIALAAAAPIVLAASAFGQEQATPAAVQVDRVALHPGETKAFTITPGNHHPLLHMADAARPPRDAIVVRYRSGTDGAMLRVTSTAGLPLSFSVLADPIGSGGFVPAGEVGPVPGNGAPVDRRWAAPLGTINIGSFVAG